MSCTVDHLSVAVPLRLFPQRIARVNIEGTPWLLASQAKEVCAGLDVDRIAGMAAQQEVRALLVAAGDIHPSTTRVKLGKCQA